MTGSLTPCGAEALRLLPAGIPTVAIRADGSKEPTVCWGAYQTCLPTVEKIRAWHREVRGLAAICGVGSGNLEDLDIDALELIEPWRALVAGIARGLVERLVEIETPSGGRAFAYRHEGPCEGNQKLAQEVRWDPAQGRRRTHTLIETRADGGYFLIPPTPAHCHPDGRPYMYRRGHLAQVPTITAEERTILLDAARSFNKMAWRVHEGPRAGHSSAAAGTRPGDAYAAATEWPAILEHHGWVAVYRRGDVTYWRRPGKPRGVSATTNYGGSGLLYVFSSNAAPFESDASYSKFAAYTLLEHDGDYAAAARAKAQEGFGDLGRYAKEHHGSDLSAAAKELARQKLEADEAERERGQVAYRTVDRITGEVVCVRSRSTRQPVSRPTARYAREVR